MSRNWKARSVQADIIRPPAGTRSALLYTAEQEGLHLDGDSVYEMEI